MQLAQHISSWLRSYASKAGAQGYVVGLSGGIDSACTAALCQQAMGSQVLGVLLPCHSAAVDAEMAALLGTAFGLETLTLDVGPIYDAALARLPEWVSGMAVANLKARLRMATLYTLGQSRGYLVAGTGNRSELMIGYFTKYGDGGVDVEPLGGLFKWQVRQLALGLGIPQPIIDRPPTAGLWPGQTDEDEMGLSYSALDETLAAIEAGLTDNVDPVVLTKVREMIAKSAHKRSMPPICPIPG